MQTRNIILSGFISLFLLLGFQACKSRTQKVTVKKIDTITTASGLKYIITKSNPSGELAEAGDQISAMYTGMLLDSSIFDSNVDTAAGATQNPFEFVLGENRVIQGWEEGFSLLRKGEKAILILPAELGYGSRGSGSIPPNATIVFDVELVQIKKPVRKIGFELKNKDTITLPSGLKYLIIDKGDTTKKAIPGKKASIYYEGFLMDSTKFDGNFGTFRPLNLPVVGAGVIEGWKQIIPLMNVGMKLRAIIPPHLAYGSRGYPGFIPPDATLIFDMYLDQML